MAVKMLTGIAGDEFAIAPGEKWEGGAENEARLIAAGLAEPWVEAEEEKPAPKKKAK